MPFYRIGTTKLHTETKTLDGTNNEVVDLGIVHNYRYVDVKNVYEAGSNSKTLVFIAKLDRTYVNDSTSIGTLNIASKVANYQSLTAEDFYFKNFYAGASGNTQMGNGTGISQDTITSSFSFGAYAKVTEYNAATGDVTFRLGGSPNISIRNQGGGPFYNSPWVYGKSYSATVDFYCLGQAVPGTEETSSGS